MTCQRARFGIASLATWASGRVGPDTSDGVTGDNQGPGRFEDQQAAESSRPAAQRAIAGFETPNRSSPSLRR